MKRSWRLAHPWVPLATLLLLGGCADLAGDATPDRQLTGNWTLDAARSESIAPRLDQALATAQAREERRRQEGLGTDQALARARGRGGDASVPDAAGAEPRIGPDFHGLHDKLLEALTPAQHLHIEASADQVSVQSDALPPREYRPDDRFARVDDYGTARMSTDWVLGTFRVTANYIHRGTRTDRYTRDPKSDQLTVSVLLNDPVVGKLELRSVYRRD